jgi:antitoxin component YwqK of YwqJK toxin-antitoxin module
MKNIICILAIVSFLSGCDSNDRNNFLEKIGLKERITTVIQVRNGIVFLPNENEPYTGKYEEYDSDGHKRAEETYKDGKLNGLLILWYENGQKTMEIKYKDGKENGLATHWDVNGQKMDEVPELTIPKLSIPTR